MHDDGMFAERRRAGAAAAHTVSTGSGDHGIRDPPKGQQGQLRALEDSHWRGKFATHFHFRNAETLMS
jgi:hypothetical protein